jgi:hypothetical protein
VLTTERRAGEGLVIDLLLVFLEWRGEAYRLLQIWGT